VAIHQTTQHEGRGEEKNKEGGAAAGRRTERSPEPVRTTLLSELHGHDSSLHRHPLALNTDGEPYAAETSS